jgi:hypothetical protein
MAPIGVVLAFAGPWESAGPGLLEAVGYVVISIAVFDVAKYFIEEEVIRGREMRLPSEARRSLTKFVSTIIIAVFIEGLVQVFGAAKEGQATVGFEGSLLLIGAVIILGLGGYQWLSASVEERVEAKDEAAEEADAARPEPRRKGRR